MTDVNIGKGLRHLREDMGIDITEVSIDTGYSESHIEQMERNKRMPSVGCLINLMDYYGCDANTIFGIDEGGSASQMADESIESRVKSLPQRDRVKAEKLIDAVLETFAPKEVE